VVISGALIQTSEPSDNVGVVPIYICEKVPEIPVYKLIFPVVIGCISFVFIIDAFIVLIFIVVPDAVPKLEVDAFKVEAFDVDEFVVPLFAVELLDVELLDVELFDVELFEVELFEVDVLLIDEFAFETFNVVNVIEGKLIVLTFILLTFKTDVELPQFIIVVVSVNKLTILGGEFDCIASIESSLAVIMPPSITPPAPSSYEIMPFIDFVTYALFVCVDIYIIKIYLIFIFA
jgi:hypothetical protein